MSVYNRCVFVCVYVFRCWWVWLCVFVFFFVSYTLICDPKVSFCQKEKEVWVNHNTKELNYCGLKLHCLPFINNLFCIIKKQQLQNTESIFNQTTFFLISTENRCEEVYTVISFMPISDDGCFWITTTLTGKDRGIIIRYSTGF